MAYMRDLELKCKNCAKRATKEVFNARNAPAGQYCSACAIAVVKQLQRLEAESQQQNAGA